MWEKKHKWHKGVSPAYVRMLRSISNKSAVPEMYENLQRHLSTILENFRDLKSRAYNKKYNLWITDRRIENTHESMSVYEPPCSWWEELKVTTHMHIGSQ